VRKEDPAEVTAAFRELFIAAKGGALGIFTSIQRLKSVHEKLLEPLQKSGLPLYAQHVDAPG
jgi:ATP-dependent DNA helicase DinG